MSAIFYIGDDFNLPIQLYDEATDTPITIDGTIEIKSSIAKLVNNVPTTILAECTVTPMAEQGFVMLSVDHLITSNFPVCNAIIDFKVTMDGKIKTSQSILFQINKGATL